MRSFGVFGIILDALILVGMNLLLLVESVKGRVREHRHLHASVLNVHHPHLLYLLVIDL